MFNAKFVKPHLGKAEGGTKHFRSFLRRYVALLFRTSSLEPILEVAGLTEIHRFRAREKECHKMRLDQNLAEE